MSPQEARFVDEYLTDLNATQAAIRAGYSPRTAHSQGSRLLKKPTVADAVARAQAERSKRTGITADRVLREYARVAFARIPDVLGWDADGTVRLRPSADLSEDDAAAVAEITQTPTPHGLKLSLKLHSKEAALRALAAHLGIGPLREGSEARSAAERDPVRAIEEDGDPPVRDEEGPAT